MLDKKEIAAHYKVSVPTIDRLMTQGLPFTKIGKSVRFDLEEVKIWLAEKQEEV